MAAGNLIETWLKDAHGMERAIAEFTSHIQKHHGEKADIAETFTTVTDTSVRHEGEVKALLKDDGSDVSGGKDLVGRLTSFISGAGSTFFHDDEVKDVLVLHAVLHFAHACYVSLANGAKAQGEDEIASVCERIANEKEDLAHQVLDIVPVVTSIALSA